MILTCCHVTLGPVESRAGAIRHGDDERGGVYAQMWSRQQEVPAA